MERIKQYLSASFLLVIFSLVAIYLVLNTVDVIVQNWRLQQQIATLKSEVDILRAENESLSYDIEYFKTDQYLEQAAREDLNRKAPGETVTIVGPINQTTFEENTVIAGQKVDSRSNWQAWVDFLLGRDAEKL